jgi:hypothetical protein
MAELSVTSRCRFLELPPGTRPLSSTQTTALKIAELRNRIYFFAAEMKYDPEGNIIPRLLVKSPDKPTDRTKPWTAQKYFGLTQVCKQIRAEYRPLWLRDSTFRIDLPKLCPFITTYYPKIEDYENAPKSLLINWDHGNFGDEYSYRHGHEDKDDKDMVNVLTNITLILRLRARCKTFTCEFIKRPWADDTWLTQPCPECGHALNCGCDDNDCDYHEEAQEEAEFELHWQYCYLHELNAFLANSNEAWLRLIREDRTLQVQFTMEYGSPRPTFHIFFAKGSAPAYFKKQALYKGALQFLDLMGMGDLDETDKFEFVIGENTGKYTRQGNCCGPPIPIYNQVHISGLKKKKRVTATAAPAA